LQKTAGTAEWIGGQLQHPTHTGTNIQNLDALFTWDDGNFDEAPEVRELAFQNFSRGEPNNWNNNEKYILTNWEGRWNDSGGGARYSAIYEIRLVGSDAEVKTQIAALIGKGIADADIGAIFSRGSNLEGQVSPSNYNGCLVKLTHHVYSEEACVKMNLVPICEGGKVRTDHNGPSGLCFSSDILKNAVYTIDGTQVRVDSACVAVGDDTTVITSKVASSFVANHLYIPPPSRSSKEDLEIGTCGVNGQPTQEEAYYIVPTEEKAMGWASKYYEFAQGDKAPTLDKIRVLDPDFERVDEKIDFKPDSATDNWPGLPINQFKNNFATYHTTYFVPTKTGQYTFSTFSDDGSMLYIDGKNVVNNDLGEDRAREAKNTMDLLEGKVYKIEVVYFYKTAKTATLKVRYAEAGSTALVALTGLLCRPSWSQTRLSGSDADFPRSNLKLVTQKLDAMAHEHFESCPADKNIDRYNDTKDTYKFGFTSISERDEALVIAAEGWAAAEAGGRGTTYLNAGPVVQFTDSISLIETDGPLFLCYRNTFADISVLPIMGEVHGFTKTWVPVLARNLKDTYEIYKHGGETRIVYKEVYQKDDTADTAASGFKRITPATSSQITPTKNVFEELSGKANARGQAVVEFAVSIGSLDADATPKISHTAGEAAAVQVEAPVTTIRSIEYGGGSRCRHNAICGNTDVEQEIFV
jgi:hypothetical protein